MEQNCNGTIDMIMISELFVVMEWDFTMCVVGIPINVKIVCGNGIAVKCLQQILTARIGVMAMLMTMTTLFFTTAKKTTFFVVLEVYIQIAVKIDDGNLDAVVLQTISQDIAITQDLSIGLIWI